MHGKVLKLRLETHSILSSLNILFHINTCHITEASSSITRTENESLPVANYSTLDFADLISPAKCDNRCASLNIEYRSQGKYFEAYRTFVSLSVFTTGGWNRVSILYPDSNLENEILTVAIS